MRVLVIKDPELEAYNEKDSLLIGPGFGEHRFTEGKEDSETKTPELLRYISLIILPSTIRSASVTAGIWRKNCWRAVRAARKMERENYE